MRVMHHIHIYTITQAWHIQVSVGSMVTAGSLGGVMVSTLTRNARDVGSISALGPVFPIFIIPMTLVPLIRILSTICGVWLHLPCVCICRVTACN